MTVKVWPFPVNWTDSFSITYKTSTEIITSRNRKEQRLGAADEPRKTFEWSALVKAASRRRLVRMLDTWMTLPIVMHEAPRFVKLTSAAADGDSTLESTEVTSWLAADRYVVLNHGDAWAYAQVASLVGTTLTLADPLDADWPAGTRVYCGSVGRLTDFQVAEHSNDVWSVQCTYRVDPGSEPAEDLGTAGDLFNGREIFEFTPNWADEPSSTWDRTAEDVDYGYGVIETFYPAEFSSRTRKANFTALTATEAERLRAFFYRMNGRQEEFTMATGEPDITGVTAGDNTFLFCSEAGELLELYGDSTVYKAIRLRWQGADYYRAVTLFETFLMTSVLTPFPWPILDLNDLGTISWAPVWRLASDEMTIEWLTDGVAQIGLSFVTLEDRTGD